MHKERLESKVRALFLLDETVVLIIVVIVIRSFLGFVLVELEFLEYLHL